jgi:hypothetical protein
MPYCNFGNDIPPTQQEILEDFLDCSGSDILQGKVLLWKLSVCNITVYSDPNHYFGPYYKGQ